MNIRQQLIEGQEPHGSKISNYQDISAYDLARGFDYKDDDFISSKRIKFRERVIPQYFRGEQLFYYPELTNALRNLPQEVYPYIIREYPFLSDGLKGLMLFRELMHTIEKSHLAFQSELRPLREEVNRLIARYGNNRYYPIIDAIHGEEPRFAHQTKYYSNVTINGVAWGFAFDGYEKEELALKEISWHSLLQFKYGLYKSIEIADAKIGTPFIALRHRMEYNHKGHIIWYNLDTCQAVKAADMRAWQMPS